MSLKISEYGKDGIGQIIPMIRTPDRVQPSLPVGTTSAQSEATQNEVVRIVATVACHLAFGPNPTATTASEYWPAGAIEMRLLGKGVKIAVIAVDA